MKRDARSLRRRIILGLACLPLTLSPGLWGGEHAALADPPPTDAATPPPLPESPPPEEPPSTLGRLDFQGVLIWCGNRDDVVASAPQAAKHAVNQCPLGVSESQLKPLMRLSLVPDPEHRMSIFFDEDATEHQRSVQQKDACCYMIRTQMYQRKTMGRPLIVNGEARMAATREREEWVSGDASMAVDVDDLTPAQRASIAEGWLSDARAEHASIASFARFALELQSLGAPPWLLERAISAGLDEVHHARGCYSLASAYAGRALGPGPLEVASPRAVRLEQLACDAFLEACVEETAAVLSAARARVGCVEPAAMAVLDEIVEDETRHATLAWGTLAWCIARGGAPVREALARLRATVAEEVEALSASLPEEAEPQDPALVARGRLAGCSEARSKVDAWREISAPLIDALLAS